MKSLNKSVIATLAGICALASAAPAHAHTFWLSITRVAQTDNLDKLDQLGSDKADFYAVVWVNGVRVGKSKVVSTDDGPVAWKWKISTPNRYAKVRIALMDDDGGLEGKDDHTDINSMKGGKDLLLNVDTNTGRFTGSMSGRRNVLYHAAGEGDGERAQLWFSIR